MDKKQKVKKIIIKLKELFPKPKIALDYSNVLELLVATILSAQCTDKVVNKVTPNLFKKYRTVTDYANADLEEFKQYVRSVTFYNNKAKNIINATKIIRDKFQGRVPDTMEDLLILPGVARKTANVVLGVGYKKPVGIVVDTHVRRLSKLHGLTTHDDPVKIEEDLMSIVPKNEWVDFSLALVLYGRTYCTGRPHNHVQCPLAQF